MPILPDDPLRKVTLNLYESDCEWFEATYGRGWTERIRQHIHNEVTNRKEYKTAMSIIKSSRRTLGDLSDDNQ